jgi:hypothetical protein
MATKKEATKKKATTKKTTTKKTTKKVAKVTEEQFPSLIKEELGESTVEEKKIDWEKYKVDEGEYDLTKASNEEVTSAFKEMKPDDEVFVTKNKPIVVEETEVMNGDPAVLTPVENTDAPVEEAVQEEVEIEQTAHKENKPKKGIINRIFGYIWNGQEMDY